MIPQSFIQDLLNRLDIVDVIERYIPLKKAGANYVACCPFHGEKTPSFTVSPAKQFYHCFGCGAHGTAIGFVMEHQGLGFVEAVTELAKSLGLSVPMETTLHDREVAGAREKGLPEIMQEATRYYRHELKGSQKAIAYLKGRGLTGEIAARFGIGFAPEGWQNLRGVFPDYESKALVETGLVIEGEGGKRYDRFRDRVMFPIIDMRGNVIGFGGRVIGKGEPKYLNSPETPLFEKGRELYGLYQARKAIRDAGRVVVVEGYMDVVALAQHGVEYAVATLGTATTPIHVQKLLRQADQVIYCFDGDEAGRRAAWRALENSLAILTDKADIRFLFLPEGEDPDSYVRKVAKEGFEGFLDQSLTLSQFLLKELTGKVDMQTQEGRAHFLNLAKPLVLQMSAPTLGLMLRKRIAELAGVTQVELDGLYGAKHSVASGKKAVAAARPRSAPSILRKLIQMLMFKPGLAQGVEPAIAGDEDAESRAFGALLELLGSNPNISHAQIWEYFRGSPVEEVLRGIAPEPGDWDEAFDVDGEFAGAIEQVRKKARNRRIDELRALSRTQPLTADQNRELQQLLGG